MAESDGPARLFDLAGRIACVTGASSGLGRHAASVLAAAGARVVGVARRARALREWQDKFPNQAAIAPGDVADQDQHDDLVSRIVAPFGPPDIIVHAAGLNPRQSADNLDRETWDFTMSVNLAAPFFLSQALVPSMKDREWGRIVNFASLQSYRAFPDGLAYGAAKGGLTQLTRAMAAAWSGSGINVNAIAPGFFETELTQAVFADPERRERNAHQTCIGRNGDMTDLDGPLLFLCSEASRYVTGQILMLDGGFTAK